MIDWKLIKQQGVYITTNTSLHVLEELYQYEGVVYRLLWPIDSSPNDPPLVEVKETASNGYLVDAGHCLVCDRPWHNCYCNHCDLEDE